MRAPVLLLILLALGAAESLRAQSVEDQAKDAAGQVLKSMGTSSTLNANGMQPLASGTQMQTVDGSQQFGAQVSCQASQQFMRVTILPDATSDIQTIAVDIDPNFTGSFTSSAGYAGPFAAVCNNGVIQCDAGTFANCRYQQWQPNPGTGNVSLVNVGAEQLGACYCFNNYCGKNLLFINSGKVLNDLGSGIALALNQLYPRLSVSQAEQPDSMTLVYYGQNASCGTDSSPEQFYSHAQDLPAAGVAASNQPGTVASFMASTPAAAAAGVDTIQCSVSRSVALDEVTRDGILSLVSMTRGSWLGAWRRPGCDPADCIDFVLGDDTPQLYPAGNACKIYPEDAVLNVARPDRITSATLLETDFDDYGQVWVGNALVFSSTPAWNEQVPYPSAHCETGRNHPVTLNSDVTALFTNSGPTMTVSNRTAAEGTGDGNSIFEIRVSPGCKLGAESVSDGCAAAEANKNCGLWEEWRDGVQTVKDGLATGLAPIASSQSLTGTSCSLNTGNRPWWSTTRIYQCATTTSAYDFTDVMQRRQTVLGSLNPTSGDYTDRILNPDGTVTMPDGNVPLPPPQASGCIQTCETRTAAAGSAVPQAGPQSNLNTTGVAWIYNYKDCSSGTCPLADGEEQVAACNCQSNFAQAAAMMQTIRMVKQDQVCTQ